MSLLGKLFRRLGYVKLSEYGLTLAEDGRVVYAYPRPEPRQTLSHPVVTPPPAEQPENGYQRLAMPAPLQARDSISAASAPAQHSPHPPYAAPAPAPTDSLHIARGSAHKERPEWLARGSSTMPAMGRTKQNTQMLWTGVGDARVVEQTIRPAGDRTQILDLKDILDARVPSEPAAEVAAPGMTPDVTRVDFRLPEFEIPSNDND